MFEVAKATVYGRYVGALDKSEGVAGLMVSGAFNGVGMFEVIDIAAGATIEALQQRLAGSFDIARSAISIINPLQ